MSWGNTRRHESPWGWRDFEEVLRIRLNDKKRRELEKRLDITRRDEILEALPYFMLGEERGHAEYVDRAWEKVLSGDVVKVEQAPLSKLGAFAQSQGAVRKTGIHYKSAYRDTHVQGMSEWLREFPWLSDYVTTFRYASEIPLDFLVCCGLATIAVGLSNKLRIENWGLLSTPNIYVLLVGDAGETHKSTAISHARRLVKEAHPEWWTLDSFSQQALEQSLSTRPYGLVVQDEFYSLLTGGHGSYKSDVRDFLRTLHNCISYQTSFVKRGNTEINYPSVTLLGGITQSQFWEASDKGMFMGGLFSRLISCWDLYKGVKTDDLSYDDLSNARASLVSWVRAIEPQVDTTVIISRDGQEKLTAWDERMKALYNQPDRRFWGASLAARTGDMVLRIATLLWASRSVPEPRTSIPMDCLEYAMLYTERLTSVAHEAIEANYAANPDDRILQNVIGFVTDQGGSTTYDALLRHLRVMRNVAKKAVDTLKDAKVLYVEERDDDVEGATTKLSLIRRES